MRYAVECNYNGSKYQGWQSQPHKITVQQAIEKSCSTFLRSNIEITGCGRTDTGVHAKKYVFHFDLESDLPKDFVYHLNAILPPDIAFSNVAKVPDEFHARFSATQRTYEYHIHGFKSPFIDQLSYRFRFFDKLNLAKLQEAADLLKTFDSFFPFCLSDSGNENYKVNLTDVRWTILQEGQLLFTISANRFLRGMVRLITGMCLNVAIGQLSLDEVRSSLIDQKLLSKSLSIPSHGLYLTEINYPDILF
ncbi:MAG: tRNA pseudouridine(38-40) synthase TruA [Saprospiraceae bacterium]